MLKHVETELSNEPYLAGGEFNTADIMMPYLLEAASARNGMSAYPGISLCLDRIHARPTYATALKRDGLYEVL